MISGWRRSTKTDAWAFSLLVGSRVSEPMTKASVLRARLQMTPFSIGLTPSPRMEPGRRMPEG